MTKFQKFWNLEPRSGTSSKFQFPLKGVELGNLRTAAPVSSRVVLAPTDREHLLGAVQIDLAQGLFGEVFHRSVHRTTGRLVPPATASTAFRRARPEGTAPAAEHAQDSSGLASLGACTIVLPIVRASHRPAELDAREPAAAMAIVLLAAMAVHDGFRIRRLGMMSRGCGRVVRGGRASDVPTHTYAGSAGTGATVPDDASVPSRSGVSSESRIVSSSVHCPDSVDREWPDRAGDACRSLPSLWALHAAPRTLMTSARRGGLGEPAKQGSRSRDDRAGRAFAPRTASGLSRLSTGRLRGRIWNV